VWNDLQGGNETAMDGEKLDRIENLSWVPPTVQFDIERHGAQPFGSGLAEVQGWAIDIETHTASPCHLKSRRIRPPAKRLNVVPLVERVLADVRAGACSNQCNQVVRWKDNDEFCFRYSDRFDEKNVAKKTLEGRHRRFRDLLVVELGKLRFLPLKGAALRFRREQKLSSTES
jgi:hypothetical protein